MSIHCELEKSHRMQFNAFIPASATCSWHIWWADESLTSMRYDLISTGSRWEQNRSRVRSSSKDSIVVRGNKAGTVECSKLLVENDMDFRKC